MFKTTMTKQEYLEQQLEFDLVGEAKSNILRKRRQFEIRDIMGLITETAIGLGIGNFFGEMFDPQNPYYLKAIFSGATGLLFMVNYISSYNKYR
jgi:hypothetical protein